MGEEQIQCDICQRQFKKSQLKKCKDCGLVLCPSCRLSHNCHHNQTNESNNASYSNIRLKLKPFLIIFVVLLLCVGVAVIVAPNAENIPILNDIVDSFIPDPHIVKDKSASGVVRTITEFPAGDYTESITVIADSKIYSGAKLDKSREISSGNYWAMMTVDKEQDEFYDNLLSQFYIIRDKRNLDSNEFVELLTAYVQSIPYDSVAAVIPQYPVVTAIDEMGDCDEKSMLLAGLLSKAGYDVVLLDFPDDEHMTVGIRTNDDSAYVDGYAVIETTNDVSFVSETDLKTEANIIPIGDGKITYTAGGEVQQILEYLDILDAKWNSIENSVDSSYGKSEDTYSQYLQADNDINQVLLQINEIDKKITSIEQQKIELNKNYDLGMMPYYAYSTKWNSLDSQEASLLSERKILETKYDSLIVLKNNLWSDYQSDYDNYVNTLSSRNEWANIYNLLAEGKVCDREQLYQFIIENPL